MPFIGTQPEVGGYSVLDNLTASATASYTLQKDSANFTPSSANQLLVSLNGVIQKPGTSFTISGSTLTFSSALDSSDSIDFIIAMGEPLLVGTPSDGAVNTTQLASNAVSTAKIANDAVTSAKLDTNIAIDGDLTVDTSTLKVDSSNNRVGIGTASPTQDLTIVNSGSARVEMVSGTSGTSIIDMGDSADKDVGSIRYENGSDSMNITTGGAEVLTISSDGALKAKANGAPEAGGIMHQFSNSGANTYTLVVTNVRDTSPIAHYITEFKYPNFSPDNSTAKFLQCRDSTTARLNINSDGDVQNHDNSYGSISDIKLKEQISDASEQWDDIKALKIRKFKFKTDVATGDSDEHWRLGVIAQEVEASGMNKLITEEIDVDVDDEGKVIETGEKTKIVKYSILYMKAVKALQEAMARIETLESEVAKLKG